MLPSRSVQSRLRVHVSPCAGVRLVQQSAVTLFARSREARASSLLRVHFSSKQSLARAAGGFALDRAVLLRFQAPRRDPSVQGRGGGDKGKERGVCRCLQAQAGQGLPVWSSPSAERAPTSHQHGLLTLRAACLLPPPFSSSSEPRSSALLGSFPSAAAGDLSFPL